MESCPHSGAWLPKRSSTTVTRGQPNRYREIQGAPMNQLNRSWYDSDDDSLRMCNASVTQWMMLLHAGAVCPEGLSAP